MSTQVKENYKIRFSHIVITFKDLFSSTSGEEIDMEEELKKLENEEDEKYIKDLEKQINTYKTRKSSKKTSENLKSVTKTKVKTQAVQEKDSQKRKQKDIEKEL